MTKKQKITSILMQLTVGAVLGHHIDDIVEKYNLEIDRYPISIEYKITENCISNHSEPIKKSLYVNKKNICICALEKTELDYSYNSFIENKDGFLDIFEEKVEECM